MIVIHLIYIKLLFSFRNISMAAILLSRLIKDSVPLLSKKFPAFITNTPSSYGCAGVLSVFSHELNAIVVNEIKLRFLRVRDDKNLFVIFSWAVSPQF
jgi:hypothetical protein